MIGDSRNDSCGRVLNYGMVGGGQGAFIGDVHRKAAAFDGKARLVSGVFSRDHANTVKTGRALGIDDARLYETYEDMAQAESERPDKLDFVAIVTPNHSHYPIARAFLDRGINVICDKPLTCTVEDAADLVRICRERDLLLGVTYTYSGYAMVKHARDMIRAGKIGEIRSVHAEYLQGWLATNVEDEGSKQAAWRMDPGLSGISNCIGDIGSHIEYTVAYITGLKIKSLCAKLDAFGPNRVLDDNAQMLVEYSNGASGVYHCSQIAIGHDNDLRIKVFGTLGSIEWAQESPDHIKVAYLGQPVMTLSRGNGYLDSAAAEFSRIPAGHPEGFYEAFANIYSAFADTLIERKSGRAVDLDALEFPTAVDGLSGVKFINKCVESSNHGAKWIDFD